MQLYERVERFAYEKESVYTIIVLLSPFADGFPH